MALEHEWEASKIEEGKIDVSMVMDAAQGLVYVIRTEPVLTNGSIDTEKTNESVATLVAEVESLGAIPDRFLGEI